MLCVMRWAYKQSHIYGNDRGVKWNRLFVRACVCAFVRITPNNQRQIFINCQLVELMKLMLSSRFTESMCECSAQCAGIWMEFFSKQFTVSFNSTFVCFFISLSRDLRVNNRFLHERNSFTHTQHTHENTDVMTHVWTYLKEK